MPLTLRDLAPFISSAPQFGAGMQSLHQGLAGFRQSEQLAESNRSNLVGEQLQRDQEQGLNTRQGVLLDAQAAAAKKIQDAKDAEDRQKLVGDFSAAALSGDKAKAMSMIPLLQTAGVSVNAPETPFKTNDLGLGMDRHMTMATPPPAPSNVFRLRHGDSDIGQLDMDAMGAEQRAAIAPMLNSLTQGARPEDRAARGNAAAGILSSPTARALPTKDVLGAYDKLTEGQLTRETSERNAAQVADAQRQRLAISGDNAQSIKWARGNAAAIKNGETLKLKEKRDLVEVMHDAIDKMQSNNGLITKEVLLDMAKAHQKGVLSDKDFERSVGGADIATRLDSMVSGLIEGDLSEAEKQRVKGALTESYRFAYGNLEALHKNVQQFRDQIPEGEMRSGADAYFDTIFNGFKFNTTQGKPAGPDTGAGKSVSVSTSTGRRAKGKPAGDGLPPAPVQPDLSDPEQLNKYLQDAGIDLGAF